jgi:hypothetical protein
MTFPKYPKSIPTQKLTLLIRTALHHFKITAAPSPHGTGNAPSLALDGGSSYCR